MCEEMNIWRIIFLAVVILQKKASSYLYSSRTLVCFSQPKGDQTKECDQSRGFKTCFTRYNGEGKVTGRGCSTKRSSYKKCETHSYGKVAEKFCYCSRSSCNPASRARPGPLLSLLGLALGAPALLSASSNLAGRRRRAGPAS